MPDKPTMRTHTHHLLCETERSIRFISGRAALGCLLDNMPSVHRAFIPIFTCDTVLEPLTLRGIPVARYPMNEDFSPRLPQDATADDLILLTNYFGLTGEQVNQAAGDFPGSIIVDAATALYTPSPAGIPCFYSPRKFCLAPTGGLAVAPFSLAQLPPQDTTDWRLRAQADAHLSPQMQVIRSERALRHRTERLHEQDSKLWKSFDWVKDDTQRRQNYATLHAALKDINRLSILPDEPPSGPMCYPLLSGIPQLRDELADAGLPLPMFWPEVIRHTAATDWENYLARNLLPLPLGPHLTEDDMHRMIHLILG